MGKVVTTLLLLVLSSSCFAEYTSPQLQYHPPNGCTFLNVQIANNTSNRCTLTSQVIHGNIAQNTSVPYTIMPGDSKTFIMEQTLLGTAVTLAVACGANKSAVITSEQSACLLWANPVTGTVLSNNNLQAQPFSETGSALWSRHGTITWVLTSSQE